MLQFPPSAQNLRLLGFIYVTCSLPVNRQAVFFFSCLISEKLKIASKYIQSSHILHASMGYFGLNSMSNFQGYATIPYSKTTMVSHSLYVVKTLNATNR